MTLRTHKKVSKRILTVEGYLLYSRYVLRPEDTDSAKALSLIYGKKTVVPMDMVLGVDNLPFKITPSMMLEIAYWAAKMNSYQDTEDYFRRSKDILLSDDTIRGVVNIIGKIVQNDEAKKAQEACRLYEYIKTNGSHHKAGVLYLQIEKDMISGRTSSENGENELCSKLALAFSEECRKKATNGEVPHRFSKGEYIGFIGSSQEFKNYLLALALRAGYGTYREIVIISSGAKWIRDITEELFPEARYFLNMSNLHENWTEASYEVSADMNRITLQSRLKLPGVRWNTSTAQYMLTLKAKIESGLWEKNVVPLVLDYFNAGQGLVNHRQETDSPH